MKAYKILHINSFNHGSTGSIMRNISKELTNAGFASYVSYPRSRSNNRFVQSDDIIFGNILGRNMHLKLAYYTGYPGKYSRYSTRTFLKHIDQIEPDIIHLHNLHNGYINLKMLFQYIKRKKIPVVWTLHDCWAFTGNCVHFSGVNCNKWKTGCYSCPIYNEYPATKYDKTKEMYHLKREWFTGIENMTIVTPSKWLSEQVSKSFLKDYPIKVINNGIDLEVFKPVTSNFRKVYNLQKKKVILGVAHTWNKKKGLDIFYQLANKLDESYKIVLVGLSAEQINNLPDNILGLSRTKNAKELAQIYSAADYFLNPSIEETMGLVTVEAIACGTPSIVSNLTAVPEMVNDKSGKVVKEYSADGFIQAITSENTFKRSDLLKWGRNFDAGKKYQEYIELYNEKLI